MEEQVTFNRHDRTYYYEPENAARMKVVWQVWADEVVGIAGFHLYHILKQWEAGALSLNVSHDKVRTALQREGLA
jgi:hypothetical protein